MNLRKNYENKYFSILGDSISTLEGFNPPENAVFYEGCRKFEAEVFSPEDTWWGQVIDRLGGRLLVNDSFSGSMVARHASCIIPSYGCSDERTSALHEGERKPDVILIFMGYNDFGCPMKPLPESEDERGDCSVFSVAYRAMLGKLRGNYPDAELWCFTLPISTQSSDADFIFPYRLAGIHLDEYCAVIRSCAAELGCRLIDLYRCRTPYDTIDKFHPNADGMKTLADAVLSML